MPEPAPPEVVLEALRKALPESKLHRIPRHPERRDILLAIFCLRMRRRYPYTESELNALLKDAITDVNGDVDHVTWRRFLVDLGFVKRDRAGTRYFLNFLKIESTLSAASMASAETLILQALSSARVSGGSRSRSRLSARDG
jgi:hypothetical protein